MAIQSNFPAIKPSLLLDFANVKQLDPRITYTRASTATYYDGVTTAMAEQNLFLQSQTFSNVNWSQNDATRTDGVTDPSGGTTAATITKTANNSLSFRQNVSLNTQNATFTLSFYLKGTGTVSIRGDNFVNQALFQQITLTASWVRYSFTFTFNGTGSTTTGAFGIGMTASDTATSFDVSFAQLEQRSALTAYTATTTQAITNYIPVLQTAASGVARFDHNPTTDESLGLLIEESRTNLLTYSDDLSNAAWNKSGVTALSNVIVAPDGTLTGDKTILDSAVVSSSGILQQQITKAASSITYTASFYAKIGEFNSLRVFIRDPSNSANFIQTYFNVALGTVASAATSGGTFSGGSSSITAVGNGWYRCLTTGTTGTETGVTLRILPYTDGTTSVTGNGYSGLYIWGAQLEAGAFATSYIPTVASQVTRAADAASMTGTNFSSWYNQGEGTFYVEAQVIGQPSGTNYHFFTADDTTNTNYIQQRIQSNTLRCQFVGVASGATQWVIPETTSLVVGSFAKSATSYAFNDIKVAVNGLTPLTDTVAIIPVLSRLVIGNGTGSGQQALNGCIKKIAYYPMRVTNVQLQALTS
tara:strand:+ start:3110 stop:4870 length:1761 start_codon:yes stop_codon:yes gene_type:complete